MKVLFCGLGGIGQRHLRNIRKIVPHAEFAAVRRIGRTFEIDDSLRPDYSVDITEKYSVRTYKTLWEAFEFRPDFAVVANPTSAHVATTTALVKERIPVFLEKPVSSEEEGLDQLVELSSSLSIPTMVGYMLRFHPGVQKLKSLIDGNRIGRLFSVHVALNSYMPSWHVYEQYNEFYAGVAALGGGVILTEVHEIDLLDWFFGAPKRLWVIGGKQSAFEFDVEDTVCCLFEHEFRRSMLPITVNMSFVQRPIGRTITLYGEQGAINWDFVNSSISVEDQAQGVRETFAMTGFERNSLFVSEIEHFLECLTRKTEPLTSLQRVASGHKTALRMRRALVDSMKS